MALNSRNINHKNSIRLSDLFIYLFVIWPFFWSIWVVLKKTASLNTSFPIYFLWLITIIFVFYQKRFSRSCLAMWSIFLGIVCLETFIHISISAIFNISVIICGVLFCFISENRNINYQMVIKWLVIVGIFVTLTIILDTAFHIFRKNFINIYTETSKEAKLSLVASGGILPYNGSAGCFIFSGFAAFIAYVRYQGKKGLLNYIIALLFVLGMIFIQKRGFIIDLLLCILFLFLLRSKKKDYSIIRTKKILKNVFQYLFLFLLVYFLYNKVPLIHEMVTSIFRRFTASDNTISGRTILYDLALDMFSSNKLFGIGWGQYRAQTSGIFDVFSDTTYAAHNVYLQLLCETGIIGLVSFLLAAGSSLLITIKKYRIISQPDYLGKEKYVITLGLFIQLFFLAYCMSGNPLYDYNFLITYFIGVMLSLAPLTEKKDTLSL